MVKVSSICFTVWSISLWNVIFASTVNITNFQNCDDSELKNADVWPVEILTVDYEKTDNGFVDTVHGSYIVRSVDTREKEVAVTISKCPLDHIGVCNSNPETYIHYLLCRKFSEDASGPWHMIGTGMTGSKCGEKMGTFKLESAKLRAEYLHQYFKEIDNFKFRIQMMFHKKDETMDDLHVRGCVVIDFLVIE